MDSMASGAHRALAVIAIRNLLLGRVAAFAAKFHGSAFKLDPTSMPQALIKPSLAWCFYILQAQKSPQF
jgi:hypothetical protein